jgi:hypothetical protein
MHLEYTHGTAVLLKLSIVRIRVEGAILFKHELGQNLSIHIQLSIHAELGPEYAAEFAWAIQFG